MLKHVAIHDKMIMATSLEKGKERTYLGLIPSGKAHQTGIVCQIHALLTFDLKACKSD